MTVLQSQRVRKWATVLLPITILVLLWLLFYWRILTPNLADRLTFQSGDFTLQFLAYRQMAFRQIAAGIFPVLEECLYSGHPFQADPQSQILYPPVLGLMLLGRALGWVEYPLRALEWEVMLHVLWAGLGLYAFLRNATPRPLHRAAAVWGACIFMFGGFLTGYAVLQTGILETFAWAPWLLLALDRLARAKRGRWLGPAGLAALIAAVAYTAGHPQTLLFMAYTGAIAYLYWSGMRQGKMAWRAILLRGVVTGALTIGFAAAQLVPSLVFAQASTRASIGFNEAGGGFQLADVWLMLTNDNFKFWQPIYVGVAALIMVIIAIVGNLRRVWIWVAIGLGALVLSFGANALGYDLAYLFAPGYGQFRSQERHAAIVMLALCILSAYGLDRLLHPLGPPMRQQVRGAGLRLINWSVFAAALVVLARVIGSAAQTDTLALTNRLVLLFAGLLGIGIVLIWRARAILPRTVWLVPVFAILVFDLFSTTRFTVTQPVGSTFPVSTLLPAITDKTPRLYNHYGLDLNMACVNGLREIGGGSPIKLKAYDTFLKRTPEDVYSRLLNVRYTATWRGGMGTDNGRQIPANKIADDKYGKDDVHLFQLLWEPNPAQEAWVASSIQTAANDDALYTQLSADGFDPFTQAVIYQRDANQINSDPNTPRDAQAGVEGSAIGYMKVAAYTASPALLVVSKAYYANWIAQVNGVPVTPIVANGALIGVPIPAGNSTIEVSYRPLDLYIGSAITGLTGFIFAVALFLTLRRKLK